MPSESLAMALRATKRRPDEIGREQLHPCLPWVTVGAPLAAPAEKGAEEGPSRKARA